MLLNKLYFNHLLIGNAHALPIWQNFIQGEIWVYQGRKFLFEIKIP